MALGGSANMAEGLGPDEGTTAGELLLLAAVSSFGAAEKAGRRSVFFVVAPPLLLLLLPVLGTKACVTVEVRARITNTNKEKAFMISAGGERYKGMRMLVLAIKLPRLFYTTQMGKTIGASK